jgi:hypothetical protein
MFSWLREGRSMSEDWPVAEKTRAGVLETAGSWHALLPRYRLRRLEELVRGFMPDLLCAEINRDDWESQRFGSFPLEYRECLLPLCRQLGAIVIPVGDRWPVPPSPLRLAILFGASLRWMCRPAALRWQRAWARLFPGAEQANADMVARILETVRRDPGRRVLVVVRVERCYAVLEGLGQVNEVEVVVDW